MRKFKAGDKVRVIDFSNLAYNANAVIQLIDDNEVLEVFENEEDVEDMIDAISLRLGGEQQVSVTIPHKTENNIENIKNFLVPESSLELRE